jgi:SAM-dependent methyltransferase
MNIKKQDEHERTPRGYEGDYHENKHQYLFTNSAYYKARAELSKKRYFNGIDNLASKKILEFGCGLGQNLFWLPPKRRVGYDISNFAVDVFKMKGGNATTDITRIPNDAFDIVLSAHVLEHVDNPLETLRVIHSKLQKGGKLILITPLDKGKKIDVDDANQHLWTWTPQLMNNLLVKAGFKPIENKIIATCAYKKLLPFRKLGLRTYDFMTRMAGRVVRDRELKFVAVKE